MCEIGPHVFNLSWCLGDLRTSRLYGPFSPTYRDEWWVFRQRVSLVSFHASCQAFQT